ncbi:hypothetical protein GWI33_004670 [Rhynchophorus ferrugineus]|uniref:CUB domain-containing protein n=1 Tax=Rhynchophorus ferrugineus TaxID=354439 RepID=A0A834IT62_RHYFE|nr:hypothetical protein GWI33_004670 [Rhynchophorus ferrugineus]
MTVNSDEQLESSDQYAVNFGKPRHVNFYTSHSKISREVPDYFKETKDIIDEYDFNRDSMTELSDRKDTISFKNIEDLFPIQRNDFLTSDYGEFESLPKNHENTLKTSNNNNSVNVNYPKNNDYVYYYTKNNKPPSENTANHYIYDNNKYKNHYIYVDKNKIYTINSKPNYSTALPQLDNAETTDDNIYVEKVALITSKHSSTTSKPRQGLSINSHQQINNLRDPETSRNVTDNSDRNKKKISNLLKQYLTRMFIGKYGRKNKYKNNTASINNKFITNELSETNQESKFLPADSLWSFKNKTIGKLKKLFSLFTVIKFNNSECNATNWAGTWQGVCYTSSECTQMGGSAFGNCASGYGVCCIFRGSCGDSSSRNCSYFKSPNYPDYYPSTGGVITPTTTSAPTTTTGATPDPRLHWYYYTKGGDDMELEDIVSGRQSNSDSLSCVFNVYKTNSDVQQVRIDFLDLDLARPTNGTCQTERLIISGQNDNDQIPILCGYNTGQHVYVDVSQVDGPLQIMVLSTNGTQKRFKMRICQYTDTCSSSQNNCLQYYTGTSGVIQSFNYDQAAMFNRSSPGYFNNLNYAICIRREAGYCSVTYTNIQNGQMYPFQLVNQYTNGQLTIPQGQAGVDILNCPDDYIIIDGTRLCGERFNDGSTTANFSTNAPVTDTSTGPIIINVRSSSNVTGLGFKLFYTQNACT